MEKDSSSEMREPKPRLRILPPMELRNNAGSALYGARYHFEMAQQLVQSRGMQTQWQEDRTLDELTRAKRQHEMNRFHWHLRAFFWELVATFDTVLHWVNQTLGLGIKEHKVEWNEIEAEAKKQTKWSAQLDTLKRVYECEWYFEVRQYRNFAHRAFLFVQGEYDADNKLKVLWLLPAREGQRENYDALEQLSSYLDEMRNLLQKFFGS